MSDMENGREAAWRDSAQVFLQPIAAPSILGLFGFAGATFMVAAYLAGWYGNVATPLFLFPFAAALGGVAQFVAAIWSYRARDALATAMHGLWGAFWMAYGLLYILVATGVMFVPSGKFQPLGYWFLVLGAITAAGAIAAAAESIALVSVLAPLAVGSILIAIHRLAGGTGWEHTGGWVLLASSFTAFYTATAMMLESTFGRVVLPLGKLRRRANVPGKTFTRPIEFELGEPGVRMGQ